MALFGEEDDCLCCPYAIPKTKQPRQSPKMGKINQKKMWSWFINQIPAASLEGWTWWFTMFAIILPILGGVCGWIAFEMNDTVSKNKEGEMRKRIQFAESALRPRRLTPEQKETLVASLKTVTPKQRVFIAASVLDAEATAFGADIESVLLAAGFEVRCPKGIQADSMFAVGPPGLHIVVKDTNAPNLVAAHIQHCFMASGIEMPGLAAGNAQIDASEVEIAVGQK